MTGGPIGGSPTYSDGVIYFASTDNFTYAVDASNGNLIWKTVCPTNSGETQEGYRNLWHTGTPTVAEGKVFIGAGISYGALGGAAWTSNHINFIALDVTDGSLVWWQHLEPNAQPLWVPTYHDGVLYVSEKFQVTTYNASNMFAKKTT